MNSFFEHHKDSVRWHYRCFDRILLNGLIQPLQQPERVLGVFNTYRQLYPVSRNTLRKVAKVGCDSMNLRELALANVNRPQLVNVVHAILVNILALKGRDFVEFETVAIPRTTGVYVSLLTALSRR